LKRQPSNHLLSGCTTSKNMYVCLTCYLLYIDRPGYILFACGCHRFASLCCMLDLYQQHTSSCQHYCPKDAEPRRKERQTYASYAKLTSEAPAAASAAAGAGLALAALPLPAALCLSCCCAF
jgi:hypothetical protein